MSKSTALGYPYPEGTDRVMDGDDAIGALAQTIDTQLGVSAAGSASVSWAASESKGQVAVTFPSGRFKAAPAVVAGVSAGSSTYYAGVGAVTASGFNLIASNKLNATGAISGLLCHWVARSM